MNRNAKMSLAVLAAAICLHACGPARKAGTLHKLGTMAELDMAQDCVMEEIDHSELHSDTLEVTGTDGNKVLIMKAVRDESGEMVASDVITAAQVTARFRNVAERQGKVELRFQVKVPRSMQDREWQIRLCPEMTVLDETCALDSVFITGNRYRRAQLRGYQQYERFLRSIITDSSLFIRSRELEIFLQRNLPEIYRMKTDTSYVCDEQIASVYGVTEREALEHYTASLRLKANDRRIARAPEMFGRYVKAPLVTEGIRLDTVMLSSGGDFVYEYAQNVNVHGNVRKIDISLDGGVFQENRKVYDIPPSEGITFYVSSLAGLADLSDRYLTSVIERVKREDSACWIDFPAGSSTVDPSLGHNPTEIGRIKSNLKELLSSRVFVMDSVVVTASCSPEGTIEYNRALSRRRGEAISDYFGKFISRCRDSLVFTDGLYSDIVAENTAMPQPEPVRLVPNAVAENWDALRLAVQQDTVLSERQKAEIEASCTERDPDRREEALSRLDSYVRLREHIYPRLRTVRFDFYMHRRDMVKDTVHTTVPDTLYRRGVDALVNRDYATAVRILRPYNDFNAALALSALEYNSAALEILGGLVPSDRTEYLAAILCSREGDDRSAAEHYVHACQMNPAWVHRGRLDPEIKTINNRYALSGILNQNETENEKIN